MRWQVNTERAVPPSELRAHLEERRDHFLTNNLVIARDPTDKSRELRKKEYEAIKAQIDDGIEAACAMAVNRFGNLQASLMGTLRPDPGPDEMGDMVQATVQVAQGQPPVQGPEKVIRPHQDKGPSL